MTNCALSDFILLLLLFFCGAGGGGRGAGGFGRGVNHENCLLLTNNQYTETGDRIRALVMGQGDL